jgi:peptide methionine sulfoxide reductase msrA/msrB
MIKAVLILLSLMIAPVAMATKAGATHKAFDATAWKKPERKHLKKLLSPYTFYITQDNGTEPPFKNKYWDNKEPGLYVDVVSGEPLFSSRDKFKSGTGWPSFTRPIVKEAVAEKKDISHGMTRVEVRSKYADSHLGHVFTDGPLPTRLRYCINSAALRFIPLKSMKAAGYEKYISAVKGK